MWENALPSTSERGERVGGNESLNHLREMSKKFGRTPRVSDIDDADNTEELLCHIRELEDEFGRTPTTSDMNLVSVTVFRTDIIL